MNYVTFNNNCVKVRSYINLALCYIIHPDL